MSLKSSLPITTSVRAPPMSGVSLFHKNPMIQVLLQCKQNSELVIVHKAIKSCLNNSLHRVSNHSAGFCLHWRLSVPCCLPTADRRSSSSSAAALQMWPPFHDRYAAVSHSASCCNNIYAVGKETLLGSPFLECNFALSVVGVCVKALLHAVHVCVCVSVLDAKPGEEVMRWGGEITANHKGPFSFEETRREHNSQSFSTSSCSSALKQRLIL